MAEINYRLIAIEVGDTLKYDLTVNGIGRTATGLFTFPVQRFPNDSITSKCAQLVHDWILSLARQSMEADRRQALLIDFCHRLASEGKLPDIDSILIRAGVTLGGASREDLSAFMAHDFHPEVVKHCKSLFLQRNYFHAVFEACKAFNLAVRLKAQSTRDGEGLMMQVWGCDRGVLKLTPCQSETDENIQDGVKFLSAGLMRAMRNPTAHEPAILWPIGRGDCLDILGLVSFLFRQLDKAVYFPSS